MIETHARHAIHERVANRSGGVTARERHVRDRLEKERGQVDGRGGVDAKFARAGCWRLLRARYLQLRYDVPQEGGRQVDDHHRTVLRGNGAWDERTLNS